MSTGIFLSTTAPAANVKPSFADSVTQLMPNGNAPLFAISSMLKRKTAINPTHSYWTKTMLFQSMTLTAAALVGDTTLTVGDTSNIVPGQVYRVNAGNFENIIVNSVASSTSVTITRAVGNVAAAAIASGVTLFCIGNAFEEASNRPTAVKIAEVEASNYTQIFRNAWAISGTADKVQKFVGDDVQSDNRKDCAKFHASDIEKALIFGQPYSGTRNGKPFRTMQGIHSSCYDNSRVNVAGATTTFDQLETMLDPCFNMNTDPAIGNKRLMFVGGTARKVVNNIGRKSGVYELMLGQTTFGLQFSTFITSRGEFTMVEHPMLNTNSSWSASALVVDLGGIGIAYLGGRDTMPEEYNIEGKLQAGDSGIDAIGGSLTTELTMEIVNTFGNTVITGLTAAA